jgi:hypothetical protein
MKVFRSNSHGMAFPIKRLKGFAAMNQVAAPGDK